LGRKVNGNEREFSVVIPVYNEGENLDSLYSQLKSVLESLGKAYEIILIDDGSTDGSFLILEKLHHQDHNVKVIQLRRNFGKTAALSAGFSCTQGKIIITMDADLQDDPRGIPNFIKKLNEGYDLVSGWRFKRQDPFSRTFPSRLFNSLTATLTGVKIHDFNCGFKSYRQEVIAGLDLYGELHRYIPALAHWKGFKVGEIKVEHRPRAHGKSKYGVGRLFRGLTDLFTVMFLTKYVKRPLHLFGAMGVLLLLIGFIINAYLAILKFVLRQPIGGRPLLLLGVLLMLIGFQTISTGLIGEMIVSTRDKGEKGYAVRKVLD
jgi:glycosyltransferase involved in cell wall biosynthesis